MKKNSFRGGSGVSNQLPQTNGGYTNGLQQTNGGYTNGLQPINYNQGQPWQTTKPLAPNPPTTNTGGVTNWGPTSQPGQPQGQPAQQPWAIAGNGTTSSQPGLLNKPGAPVSQPWQTTNGSGGYTNWMPQQQQPWAMGNNRPGTGVPLPTNMNTMYTGGGQTNWGPQGQPAQQPWAMANNRPGGPVPLPTNMNTMYTGGGQTNWGPTSQPSGVTNGLAQSGGGYTNGLVQAGGAPSGSAGVYGGYAGTGVQNPSTYYNPNARPM